MIMQLKTSSETPSIILNESRLPVWEMFGYTAAYIPQLTAFESIILTHLMSASLWTHDLSGRYSSWYLKAHDTLRTLKEFSNTIQYNAIQYNTTQCNAVEVAWFWRWCMTV